VVAVIAIVSDVNGLVLTEIHSCRNSLSHHFISTQKLCCTRSTES